MELKQHQIDQDCPRQNILTIYIQETQTVDVFYTQENLTEG